MSEDEKTRTFPRHLNLKEHLYSEDIYNNSIIRET